MGLQACCSSRPRSKHFGRPPAGSHCRSNTALPLRAGSWCLDIYVGRVTMQVDALAVRLRPRNPLEAADLGVALCQSSARSVFTCYLAVALPLFVLCLASIEFATWIPTFAIWMAKPWLDRTVLFALSRAAFGQATTPA